MASTMLMVAVRMNGHHPANAVGADERPIRGVGDPNISQRRPSNIGSRPDRRRSSPLGFPA